MGNNNQVMGHVAAQPSGFLVTLNMSANVLHCCCGKSLSQEHMDRLPQ